MNTFNKVIGIYRLGSDPDVRYTPNGMAVATLSGASEHSYKDRQNDEWVSQTEWTRFTLFSKRAESAGENLRKGSLVYIEGRMQTDEWEDRDGNKRWTTKVIVNDIKYLSNFGNSDGRGSGGRTYGRQQDDDGGRGSEGPNPFGSSSSDDDDDIPF